MSAVLALVRRDIRLALAEGSALGTALGFYLIVVTLTPLAIGPDPAQLARIAPGILWIGLLLAALLTLGRIFESDHEDGTLDVLALGSVPLELVALAKTCAHWLTTALPLVLAAPVLGLLLNLDIGAYGRLMLAMLLGTPAVSAIGGIGAALTLGSRKGALLIALLVLPLYVPTLVFGIATQSAAATGAESAATSSLLILTAISLAAIVLSPLATAAALRARLA